MPTVLQSGYPFGNTPLFVDAGTYLYHSDRRLRDAFRKTAVHNTLTIDGAPSSQPSGPFNWRKKANSRLIASETAPRHSHRRRA